MLNILDKAIQEKLYFYSIEIQSLDLLLALWHFKEKIPSFYISRTLLFRAFKVITNDPNDYLRLLKELGNPPVKEISDFILSNGNGENIKELSSIIKSWH